MRRAMMVLGFLAALLPGFRALGAHPEYTATNMNQLWAAELEARYLAAGYDPQSVAVDIIAKNDAYATVMYHLNDAGQMAGSYNLDDTNDDSRAVFWDPVDGLIDIAPLRDNSYARGLNDLGQVLGDGVSPLYSGKGWFPFLWTAETGTLNITELAGVSLESATAYDINAKGQVVGRGETFSYSEFDFLWNPVSGMHVLESREWDFGFEMVINDEGQIAGTAMVDTDDGSHLHAVVWDAEGQLHDIHPDGYTNSRIYDINNLGQMVGDIDGRACVWEDGDFQFVEGLEEVLPEAYGSEVLWTNNEGQMVGAAYPSEEHLADFWLRDTSGEVWALQDLLPSDAECDVYWVHDLNDQGWILADGYDAQGRRCTFLLKPTAVPEPSVLGALLSGMTLLWFLHHRRG